MRHPKQLRPLPRETISDLFDQAILSFEREKKTWATALDVVEAFTRLVEAELQGQVYDAAHRVSPGTGQVYKKRMPRFG